MLALLHTSPLHVPVFDALRDEDHQGLELAHFVHEDLLTRARAEGPDAVAGDVRAVLERAVADGAGAVLCTCSSIGGVAEAVAVEVGVPVLRVDRPMAAAAVAIGPRVVVVATSESTFGPTVALVEEEARRAGLPAEVRKLFVDGAWALFRAGDSEGYVRSVTDAVDSIPGDSADAIILAQASTTPAQALATTTVPVLSSPRPGLAAGAAAARAATTGRG
ncbi:aspartate/glutamate racemase family protein [Streptomyces sp. NBC_01451]|uniref:aspartate/glutamate racemase family protein n=1 Tax=Streptomyces sp. NBC_01451 TaxID=2903872 RepID=UPI002E2F6E36|nr:aspartate/glutamate racemase family protein [Streptomyces sp. NBC_01451]